jgi:hypothetical protein
MEQVIKSALAMHIAAGSLSLVSGPLAIGFKHGGKWHRVAGKIFFFAMLMVAATAFFLGLAHQNYFLFIVAIFSAYLVSSGYRILYLKKLGKSQKPALLDWSITGTMFLFSLSFFAWGSYLAMNGISFSLVYFTFGGISFWLVMKDRKLYRSVDLEKNFWLYAHITKMIAGLIAAFTAFLVVNVQFQPGFVVWIFPSFVGGWVIRYYTTLNRKKLTQGKEVEELVLLKKQ